MDLRRRDLLTMSTAAGVCFALSPGRSLEADFKSPIRPIFVKSDDPVVLAREHRRLGYSSGYCPEMATLADSKLLNEISRAFAAENVLIAEVGAWKNLLDPDPVKRRKNLDYVTQRCALADAVGALCCVDIAGSYNPSTWYGPDPKNLSREFFDATVENCRHILEAVKPTRTRFTIEKMGWNLPDGLTRIWN
jgi:sugar phosphate isomerase/epimerase